ncbi:MAG: hypothetical protein J6Y99_02145 [Bacteroidales bacterium]|nr:hypothetical protein [Bacteroidales bacterium]
MRTYRLLLVLLLCSMGTIAMAQAVQSGRVVQYNGKEEKTPLKNVSVSAVGAPAVQSDADGLFELQFRTLHAGDAIQFRRVELAGYEVMNAEALAVARVANASDDAATEPFVIVMCKSSELGRLRDGYRDVATARYQKQLEEAQAQLQRLKKEGKMQQAEYDKQLDALEEKFEAQMQTLDTYVDKFARIDLSELDEAEAQIIALVQEGKIDEAIACYDAQNLTQRLQQGVQEQRQLTRDVQTVDQAIDQKKMEGQRIERNIEKQNELRSRLKQPETQL